MNLERLKKIIEYSDKYRKDMDGRLREFYMSVGMESDQDVLNVMQILRPAFENKGYLILEIPLADTEIGALCYKGDALGYIILNSSLPRVNVNFAICHEMFHVYYQQEEFRSKIEFASEHYYEHGEEYAANLFAGMLLMPETSFRFMYRKFRSESRDETDTIVRLMNYYEAPYMAVLIRCYELKLIAPDRIPEELQNPDRENIRRRFIDLWLDERILDATKKDDYVHLETVVKAFGEEYIEESYLSERTLQKVLRNIRVLYKEIRGE